MDTSDSSRLGVPLFPPDSPDGRSVWLSPGACRTSLTVCGTKRTLSPQQFRARFVDDGQAEDARNSRTTARATPSPSAFAALRLEAQGANFHSARPPTPPRPRHSIMNTVSSFSIPHALGAAPLVSASCLLVPGSRRGSRSSRNVSFSVGLAVAETHSAAEYDRSCIDPEPLTGRDVAALFMFRLSLPGFQGTTREQAQRQRRSSICRANEELHSYDDMEAVELASVSSASSVEDSMIVGSDVPDQEDWIAAIAQKTRFTCASHVEESSWNSVWDRVDRCAFQVVRI
ncbi:hypothetical protein BC830DRAFT_1167824 [Chytriomyces sp. MP71]|nr:hypothetical protein BC830DRAFT_1167824 [Chytriomyces sp. MP71]